MEIENLKNTWQKAGERSRSQSDLAFMTQLNKNPRMKRVKTRLLIESTMVLLVMLTFYSGFDGSDKPMWISILVLLSSTCYVLIRLFGFSLTNQPSTDLEVVPMAEKMIKQLNTLSLSTGVSALFFSGSMILFLTIDIDFTAQKYAMLAALIIGAIVFTFLSHRIWDEQISRLSEVVHQLSGDSKN